MTSMTANNIIVFFAEYFPYLVAIGFVVYAFSRLKWRLLIGGLLAGLFARRLDVFHAPVGVEVFHDLSDCRWAAGHVKTPKAPWRNRLVIARSA